ncbi:MAG: hypothetical protein JW395_1018 [Nitrospira sp.]|nr:hypothetical protein [Nitrospira sp.]
MRTQRLISYAFAACFLSLSVGLAMAEGERGNPNALLKGTYRHSTIFHCATTPQGFTDDLVPLGGGNAGGSTNYTGVITYDGNGHATMSNHGVAIFPGPYPPEGTSIAAITFDNNCDWTYRVNPDGSFTQGGNCIGFDRIGPRAFDIPDEQIRISNIQLEGQIGVGGQVLIWNQVEPTVQTLEILNRPFQFSNKSICAYHGTAVRVSR